MPSDLQKHCTWRFGCSSSFGVDFDSGEGRLRAQREVRLEEPPLKKARTSSTLAGARKTGHANLRARTRLDPQLFGRLQRYPFLSTEPRRSTEYELYYDI